MCFILLVTVKELAISVSPLCSRSFGKESSNCRLHTTFLYYGQNCILRLQLACKKSFFIIQKDEGEKRGGRTDFALRGSVLNVSQQNFFFDNSKKPRVVLLPFRRHFATTNLASLFMCAANGGLIRPRTLCIHRPNTTVGLICLPPIFLEFFLYSSLSLFLSLFECVPQ